MSIKAEDNIMLESQKPIFDIASDTNQYFWHTATGTDTGAHITEIPKEDFLDDPENGGGNLLARSNGLVVRDGLEELTRFGAQGIQVGKDGEQNIVITPNMFGVYDGGGGTPFYLQTAANPTTNDAKSQYIVNASSTVTVTLCLRGTPTDGKFYVAVGESAPTSYSQYIENPSTSGSSITIDNVTVTITDKGNNTYEIVRANDNASKRYVYVKASQTYYYPRIMVNQRRLQVLSSYLSINAEVGSVGNAYIYQYGNIASVRLPVYNANIANKGVVFRGHLLNLLPASPSSIIGWTANGIVAGEIYTDGLIDIRNFTGASLTATEGSPVELFGTYIIDESSF